MPKFLKVSKRLLELLEEEALVVVGDGAQNGLDRTETASIQWDPDDATSGIDFKRTVKRNAADRVIEKTAWASSNVPTVGSVTNAAQGGAAKASLEGSSTLVIASVGNIAVFGAQAADLEVWMSLPSDPNRYCTHPSIRTVYKGEITILANANAITAVFSFPPSEGTKIPGKGDAELIVRNIKQQVQSDAFTVEIV